MNTHENWVNGSDVGTFIITVKGNQVCPLYMNVSLFFFSLFISLKKIWLGLNKIKEGLFQGVSSLFPEVMN